MKPRIIFFGTPNFAVGILDEIRQGQFHIDAVVTSPNRKSGRGRKIVSSPVKNYCIDNKIKTYQPENLKDESFVSQIKNYESDIFVVVAFRMMPEIIWSIPKMGTFNLHASLLPDYRGAAPINWVIINQEKKTGVTTFFIDHKIDTGKILLKSEYLITKDETFDSLHDNLLEIGKTLVKTTIQNIYTGNSSSKSQKNTNFLKSAPKLTRENTKINWSNSLSQIVSFINGLNSYPGAWTKIVDNEKESSFKIFKSELEYVSHNYNKNNLIVVNKQIKISHKEGFLIVTSLQLPNKKRLSNIQLLNGFTFNKGVLVS